MDLHGEYATGLGRADIEPAQAVVERPALLGQGLDLDLDLAQLGHRRLSELDADL